MATDHRQSASTLRARTTEAHRAYIEALAHWERALHTLACSRCRPTDRLIGELTGAAAWAEFEKERCRVRFRDLAAELGYVPVGEGAVLPQEEPTCMRQ